MRFLRYLVLGFGLQTATHCLQAQAVYTATRPEHVLVGVGALYLHNDYTVQGDQGLSAWLDLNFSRYGGLEIEAHFGSIASPSDFGENSVLIGPRAALHLRRSTLYAKGMLGRGTLIHDLSSHVVTASYTAYAAGGGVDFHCGKGFSLRLLDAEFQSWSNFRPHRLSPYDVSVGILYSIH